MLKYLRRKKKAKKPTTASGILTHHEGPERPTTIRLLIATRKHLPWKKKAKKPAAAVAATVATPESPRPVLSSHGRGFPREALEDTDDQPVFILQGSEFGGFAFSAVDTEDGLGTRDGLNLPAEAV